MTEPRIRYASIPHAENTDAGEVNRFERRVENMFSRHADRIAGKRVLDLACNTGRLSYPLLMLGAAQVTGVEARHELIEKGRSLFAASEFAGKMHFRQGDLFEFLESSEPGEFDVIVCAGFLYHTVRHADFFRALKRLRPETVFVDTSIAKNYLWFGRRFFGKPPALFMYQVDASKPSDTTDPDGIVYWPSASYIEAMLAGSGYSWDRIDYRADGSGDWTEMEDYKGGARASYIGRRN